MILNVTRGRELSGWWRSRCGGTQSRVVLKLLSTTYHPSKYAYLSYAGLYNWPFLFTFMIAPGITWIAGCKNYNSKLIGEEKWGSEATWLLQGHVATHHLNDTARISTSLTPGQFFWLSGYPRIVACWTGLLICTTVCLSEYPPLRAETTSVSPTTSVPRVQLHSKQVLSCYPQLELHLKAAVPSVEAQEKQGPWKRHDVDHMWTIAAPTEGGR